MPIYEFKCLNCDHHIELLVMNHDDIIDLKCTDCDSKDLERIVSTTNTHTGSSSGKNAVVTSQTRTCSSGSCTTYEIPGHRR